jgi:hypothetical protein
MRRGAPDCEKSDGEGVWGGGVTIFYFILFFILFGRQMSNQLGGEWEPWCDK